MAAGVLHVRGRSLPDGDPVTFNYRGQMVTAPRAQALPATAGYTVFGKVVSGLDVVNKMKSTPTGAGGPFPSDVPKTPILINSATLVK